MNYIEEYKTITESLARGELGLLIGAGMSYDSDIPVGSEMAKHMLRRAVLGSENNASLTYLDKLASQLPFEAIAEYVAEKDPYHSFANWLKDKGNFDSAKPNDAHRKLHELYRLLPHRFPKTLFTTNFDTLIEKAFRGDAIGINSENLDELPRARKDGKIAVIHLHGCITHPKSVIVGEITQSTIEGPLLDLFRAALATEIFVMVGYSLTDTNLRNVFFDVQRAANTRYGLKKRTFTVSPAEGNPNEATTEAGVMKKIWLQRNVEHLSMGAVDFFNAMFLAADDFLNIKIMSEVANALGKEVATLEEMLRTAAEPFGVIEPYDILIHLYYSLTPLEKRDD